MNPSKTHIPKVLLFQRSSAAEYFCHRRLSAMGLIEDSDFIISRSESSLFRKLVPGHRQLFITGSVGGRLHNIQTVLEKMRDRNIELVCMSYSMYDLPGSFDHAINKTLQEDTDGLVKAVDEFLQGKIHKIRDAVLA